MNELNIPHQKTYNSPDGFYILNDEEKKEALNIAKYIVFVKLKKQFDQIEKDFNTFLPFMFCIKRGIFVANYHIKPFNLQIDITKSNFHKITVPKILVREIKVNSRFKIYSDRYLAQELVSINSENNIAITNAFLNTHDLKIFFDHYDELSLSDSEVCMKSTFNGEGGTLNIQVQMKPIKMLRTSIAKSTTKIFIYTFALIVIMSLALRFELYTIFILGIIFILGFYISMCSRELKQIKICKSELKQYGQQ